MLLGSGRDNLLFMRYYPSSSGVHYGFGGIVPFGIKWLLISNCALFVVYYISHIFQLRLLLWLFHGLGLIPNWLIWGAIWQPVTYLFLHSPLGFGHILMNMLMLWMFGSDLERDWGLRKFLNYYFVCGIGAGLLDVAARIVLGGNLSAATIGNSGAVYGVLLAFGLLYPHRTIYVFLMFPIPARIFVFIVGSIVFLSALGGSGGSVAHFAHLGGMLFGFFYLRYRPAFLDIDWLGSYRQWQLRRARRRFQVYMKKRDGDSGRGSAGGGWVN